MARHVIGSTPFPLRINDSDEPVTLAQVIALFGKKQEISICLRSAAGPAKRGGYFFHIARCEGAFQIYDFEKQPIGKLTSDHLVRFINHTSGRQFDGEMLLFCQNVVNLRQDQTEP